MATVNLGRLKPVFKGAYNSSTAYVVDDIVTYANETYINIQAGTGQQPNTATGYWTKLASKGTDGTDVGTTITTQGDLLYRDGSGLQRLAKGTASQVLKMNTAANAPEWGNLSSDFVKLGSADLSSNTTTITFDNLFDDSVYSHYYVMFNNLASTGNDGQPRIRVLDSSGSSITSSTYATISQGLYTNSGTNDAQQNRAKWNYDHIQMTSTWTYHTPQDSSPCSHSGWFKIFDPTNANTRTHFQGYHSLWNGDGTLSWIAEHWAGSRNDSENNRGFTMYTHDGSSFLGTSNSQHPTAAVIMYGIKK